MNATKTLGRAQWLVLGAAFLGWMFDGLEMGLFPIAARPATPPKDADFALFWIGAGQAEPERAAAGKAAVESLRAAGVPAEWYEAPGTSHEWQTWRRCLHAMAPRLFAR